MEICVTMTSPDKVGKLLLTLDNTMTEKRDLEVSTALMIAPYVFLRPVLSLERIEIDW